MRILTFDIEDWFHVLDNPATDSPAVWPRLESRVADNTNRILDELAWRGVRATFFCVGWVAEHHPGIVRRIAAEGHEIGTHSYAHLPVRETQRRRFEADLTRSLRLLEDVTGHPVTCYRAPGFTLSLRDTWAFDVLVANGIAVDCSICPSRRAHGGVDASLRGPATIVSPAGRLRELPVGGERALGMDFLCSSAGYFRLCPYGLVRQQLLQRPYVMSYFHPRDFDAGQPVVEDLSLLRRFKARVGLRWSFTKFRQLLDDFAFVSVGEALQRIDWTTAPLVTLDRVQPAAAA
jgi:polysaccharide deacetylase family protein (PEP-CTERM system associated)